MSTPTPTLHAAAPPAQYLLRPPLVVDCSCLAGFIFGEEWEEQAGQQLEGRTLHAPHLLHAEIANVAVKKLRHGELHASEGLVEAALMEIQLHPINAPAVTALAMQYQLSAYDAAYLWLAADLKCPLATFDDKLTVAAKTHLSSLL